MTKRDDYQLLVVLTGRYFHSDLIFNVHVMCINYDENYFTHINKLFEKKRETREKSKERFKNVSVKQCSENSGNEFMKKGKVSISAYSELVERITECSSHENCMLMKKSSVKTLKERPLNKI